ncbi:alpha/beta hydrolase [Bartonella sp. TP]|uniref:alpha/beta hydrolase n=1 Tax=Bartonella sp. TP TaxID=3057550 RepID=UPI0025AF3BAE|nr:alpha/beta hydrolase [Bartonella sp. TP]WJW80460.1 alpha/beta hydrolase [Bartonella sp. TP]
MIEKIIVDGRTIAVDVARPQGATHNLLWLPGYLADMSGTKASFLSQFCAQKNLGIIRFDYSGVGLSAVGGQEFLQATLSDWLSEVLHIYKLYNDKPMILVGSSCGGWLALLASLALQKIGQAPEALVLLAPAPDFTSILWRDKFTQQQQSELVEQGVVYFGEEKVPFSQKFIDDAQQHHLLDGLIEINSPIYILQGQQDNVVPPEHSLALLHRLVGCDVSLSLLKDGDHRLSGISDLQKLTQIIGDIVEENG